MTTAFYANTNPAHEVSAAATGLRREEYLFWRSLQPEEDADIDIVVATLSGLTGASEGRITRIIYTFVRLEELPRLRAEQEESFHLDLDRLIAIDSALSKLGDVAQETLQDIDEELTRYLSARQPNQKLPSHRNLRRKLRDILMRKDSSIAAKDPRRRPAYGVYPMGKDSATLSLDVDLETAAVIDANVAFLAERDNITRAGAAIALLSGESVAGAKVTLNVYKSDCPDAPGFIQELGWVPSEVAERLAARASTVRDMDAAQRAVSPNYVTPAGIGAYVEGRDAVCRWPGCDVPAQDAQKDHRIDFADGGPTSAANLASLCQHHHNIKTDGRALYIMDPVSGDIVWLFEDSTWIYDEATGPLAPRKRNWVRTVAQATQGRRKAAHDEAQRLKKELDDEVLDEHQASTDNPQEVEDPTHGGQ
ncbi:HNH endonuclease signature motif containing protein [Corynebacterium flavescens]|uniref:HNH endonuclease signature motif containing protein n=1 Tax=Corynebacterium flavescens TaxID=28028 RepID=UPI003FD5E338